MGVHYFPHCASRQEAGRNYGIGKRLHISDARQTSPNEKSEQGTRCEFRDAPLVLGIHQLDVRKKNENNPLTYPVDLPNIKLFC